MIDPPFSSPDLSGCIDAHVHITTDAGIATLTASGIRAVRDAGVRGYTLPSDTSLLIQRACWALYKEGGYGARFGVAVAGSEEIRDEIARLAEAGAGILKVMASGVVSIREPGRITPGGFDRGELTFITDEAGKKGLKVMAHANGAAALIAAAEAGVWSVEHGFFMTEKAMDALLRQDVYWVPTVGALARAGSTASQEMREYLEGVIREHLVMIKKFADQGGQLAVGTDAVLPATDYSQLYIQELGYFQETGLSRGEVLAIAREGGAKLLGL